MLRLRLASLALASGVVFTLSGCQSSCDSPPLFGRLFDRSSSYRPMSHSGPECECHNSSFMGPMPTMISSPGSMMTMPPSATQIPITNIPTSAGQPPLFLKTPSAAPTPYAP